MMDGVEKSWVTTFDTDADEPKKYTAIRCREIEIEQ